MKNWSIWSLYFKEIFPNSSKSSAVGFCGSLTTMSAFALDSENLLESSHYTTLVITAIANVSLSIAALFGGKSLMSAILSN